MIEQLQIRFAEHVRKLQDQIIYRKGEYEEPKDYYIPGKTQIAGGLSLEAEWLLFGGLGLGTKLMHMGSINIFSMQTVWTF